MLYLIRTDDLGNPTRIVPQGEIDARAPKDGFKLLGAEYGDTILLIGRHGDQTVVWTRQLRSEAEEGTLLNQQKNAFEAWIMIASQPAATLYAAILDPDTLKAAFLEAATSKAATSKAAILEAAILKTDILDPAISEATILKAAISKAAILDRKSVV